MLSIIVPFYNEEENVAPLHAAIVEAVEPLGLDFEMVFVDDGSRDGTLAQATEAARRDPRVRVVRFRRNYGQTAAMAAGIEHAAGTFLVTMDGDLQNDPRDIELLLQKINEGYDIVVGWRYRRKDRLLTRKIPSAVANWLIGKVTGVPIRDNGCSLKAFRSSLIKKIPLYSEMHRFIPAVASMAGPRIAQIQVRHHARQFGESKYGLSRIYKVLLDLVAIKMVANFASRPLWWFGLLAAPLLVAGLFVTGFSLWQAVFVTGSLPLGAAGTGMLLVMAAMVLICGGALGEMVYGLGDVRERNFSRLTRTLWATSGGPAPAPGREA